MVFILAIFCNYNKTMFHLTILEILIMKMVKPLLFASTVSAFALQVQAANVNAILSWEDVRYNDVYDDNGINTGKGRNYHGYRLGMSVSPDNSNWTFNLGFRQNRSKGYTQSVKDKNPAANGAQMQQIAGKRDYQRLDFGVSYRYRFNNGWVQPSFNIRQDKTLSAAGANHTTDYYNMDLYYNYNITDRLVWNGRFKPEVVKYENNRQYIGSNNSADVAKHTRKTQFGWEIEQGLRYLVSPNFNFEIAYNDVRKRQDDDKPVWDNTTNTESNPQLRIYMTYKTSFGLTLSPYIRKSIFGKIKVKDECNLSKGKCTGAFTEKRDLTRYALRAQYQLSNNVTLMADYYRENVKFLNIDKETSKQNYLRLGMRFTF